MLTALLGLTAAPLVAQTDGGIDPEALIERILTVDKAQREQVKDVSFDAEYIEREEAGDNEVREKVRFEKEVYIKYLPDTAWYAEKYLAFYAEGVTAERQGSAERSGRPHGEEEEALRPRHFLPHAQAVLSRMAGAL